MRIIAKTFVNEAVIKCGVNNTIINQIVCDNDGMIVVSLFDGEKVYPLMKSLVFDNTTYVVSEGHELRVTIEYAKDNIDYNINIIGYEI